MSSMVKNDNDDGRCRLRKGSQGACPTPPCRRTPIPSCFPRRRPATRCRWACPRYNYFVDSLRVSDCYSSTFPCPNSQQRTSHLYLKRMHVCFKLSYADGGASAFLVFEKRPIHRIVATPWAMKAIWPTVHPSTTTDRQLRGRFWLRNSPASEIFVDGSAKFPSVASYWNREPSRKPLPTTTTYNYNHH